MRVIKRNKIRCKLCGDIIESKSIHDYVVCSCGASAVDGGHTYVKVSGDSVELLTEYEEVPGCIATVYYHFGGKNQFEVPVKDIEKIAARYEDMWHYVEAVDENNVLVYQSKGTERFKKEHGYK